MNQLRLVAILLFLLTHVAAPASAAVTYLSTFRSTSVGLNQAGTLCCGLYGPSTSQIGPFNVDVKFPQIAGVPGGGRVIMNSNIDSLGITAAGTLMAEAEAGVAPEAEANLSVRFTLDAPTPYIGSFTSDPTASFFAVVFRYIDGQPASGFGLPSQGVLPPGEYRVGASFRKFLNHDGGSFVSNYSVHFLFVPEPSTAVIFLAAGLPLLTSRRKRSKP
jgi:hypothetical protein